MTFERPGDTFRHLASVYRQAGHALLNLVNRELMDTDEDFALPAVFLYGQAVELIVKGILAEVGNVPTLGVVSRGHWFKKQLNDLVETAHRASFELPPETWSLLREFDDREWFSMSRYPIDKKGKRYPDPDFDLANFAGNVERLLDRLESLYDLLADRLYAAFLEHELGNQLLAEVAENSA